MSHCLQYSCAFSFGLVAQTPASASSSCTARAFGSLLGSWCSLLRPLGRDVQNLTSLQLVGGHLSRHGLDLGVLTSLRRLWSLTVRPHSDDELDGLEDDHLAGAARLTSLKSLSLRASENVTDEGVMSLTALTGTGGEGDGRGTTKGRGEMQDSRTHELNRLRTHER